MKTMKRFMALALASVMAVGLLAAAPVQAATYQVKKEVRYSYQDGKWVKEGSNSYTYDSKGRRTSSKEEMVFERWDDVKQKPVKYTEINESKYKYDSKGRQTLIQHKRNGDETYKAETVYKSTSTTQKMYDNGKYSGKYVATLDKNGRPITEKHYSSNNKLTSTDKFYYDSKGNVSKIVNTSSSGKKTTTTYKYTYSSKGKLTKRVIKSPTSTQTITYYSNGKVKVWIYKTKTWEDEERYDSKGLLTYTHYEDKDGGYSSTTTYKKGREDKRVSKSTYTDENGKKKTRKTTTTFEYELSAGGLVKDKIEKVGGDPVYKYTYSYTKT